MCALLDAHSRAHDSPERRRLPTKRRGSLAAGRRNFRLFRGWRYTGLLRQVVRLTARNREPGDDRLAHRNHTDGNDPCEQ